MRQFISIAVVAVILCATPASAQTYQGPTVLLVNPKSNVASFADFVSRAKQRGQPLTFATEGANSAGHKFAEQFADKLGIKVVHVPYRGASQAIVDLIAGFVDFAALPVYAAAGPIRGGLLTPLALAARQRLPDFPDLPTFAELGYPEFVAFGIIGEGPQLVGWAKARPGFVRVGKIADAPCPRVCAVQAILPTLQAANDDGEHT